MILYPNAKINLGLHVIEKRTDGFHNIETIFLPIGLSDILEFVESEIPLTEITISGIDIQGKTDDNLVVKAWRILNRQYSIPTVKIWLHKIIPIGAGLGGGSADAAFMLKGLNEYFALDCSLKELEEYAAELGSDCAFFIQNRPAIGKGRGEIVEPIELNLSGFELLLINPGIHIGTKEAYAGVIPVNPEIRLNDIIINHPDSWQNRLVNDFEKSVFKLHPEIEQLKQQLLKEGAVYASMSGSGSSVFGIFNEGDLDNKIITGTAGYFQYRGKL